MKKKHLPRLWCALQGLLPLEACLDAQKGELAWPRGGLEEEAPSKKRRGLRATKTTEPRNG